MLDTIVNTRQTETLTMNDTEQRILRAAEHEFLTKGFAGARTTAIAEAAGVTHAMLHYYFRTKERLFEKIISVKAKLITQVISNSIGDFSRPIEEIIEDIISRHIDFVAANPALPLFLLNELFSKSDRTNIFTDTLATYTPSVLRGLQQKIDEEAASGKCRRVDAGMLMLDIVSLNIFPFLVLPAAQSIVPEAASDPHALLTLRKRENLDTILRKLKP